MRNVHISLGEGPSLDKKPRYRRHLLDSSPRPHENAIINRDIGLYSLSGATLMDLHVMRAEKPHANHKSQYD